MEKHKLLSLVKKTGKSFTNKNPTGVYKDILTDNHYETLSHVLKANDLVMYSLLIPRFNMGSDIDDAVLFKVEEKLKGKLPFLRKTKKTPAIIKPMKLKPGQRSRGYVEPVRLTQEEMKKRSATHIEKMRAYRASRGWKEKVPNEQGRYTFGKRRPKADSGSYSSFGAWVSAVRKAGGVPDSELSEPQGAHNRNTGQIIGEWDGFSGSVYRTNPVRQRISVSLSRSQVRRNPFNDRNLDA